MAAVDEIAIKLGIKVGDFKAALADANASVKKLKKEGEGDFLDGFKNAKRSLGDLKSAIAGAGIGAAVVNFFNVAIEAANKSTDATDQSAAAVRRFSAGLNEAKGVGAGFAVAVVGGLNRFGETLGDLTGKLFAFYKGNVAGLQEYNRNQKLVEESAKGVEEVERNLAAVRKKHGDEFMAITRELKSLQEKTAESQLKGLTVFETEANIVKKLGELRAKMATFDGQAIDRRRLQLDIAKTQFALEAANLEVRKAQAAEQKKAAEDEKKALDDYAKAAEERRAKVALAASAEAELFKLRQKASAAAVAQGQADLSAVALQTKQMLAQIEIQKLREKIAGTLSVAEQALLAKLQDESAEIDRQIVAKKALLAASNNRNPVEEKLLASLQAQSASIQIQIKGLEARSGVTSNFTAAEGVFLAQLQKQKVAIFEQIELLERRAAIPNALTAEEEALLIPLREQGRVYTLLIGQIKERAATGNAQTAEEVQYLDALKASAATISTQIEQLRIRNAAGVGLSDTERKTLEEYRAQSVALGDIIANLQQRQNSSVGLTDQEAKLLPFYEAENIELEKQIASMVRREGATGNLAAIEAGVLAQWDAQQKALVSQIETMRARKNATDEQKAADLARLATLLEATKATEAQIAKIKEGGAVYVANLVATKALTKEEKDRLEILSLMEARKKQQVALEEAGAALIKDKTNPALQESFNRAKALFEETEKQLAQRVKISLGIKEDLELFTLQSKNSAALTESERVRMSVLELQTKEKRLQLESETLHGKLMDGTITPGENKRLQELIKQTAEVGKQIAAKQALADKITNAVVPAEEKVEVEFNGQILKVGDLIDAKTRLALTTSGVELGAEKQVTAEIAAQIEAKNKLKATSGTITNTGDITNLSPDALVALLTKLNRDLTAENAKTLTQRQDTIIEASLKQQIRAIELQMDQSREFVRLQKFLSSGELEVKYGPSEFHRLQQVYSVGADSAKQTATGVNALVNAFGKVFPDAFRNIR